MKTPEDEKKWKYSALQIALGDLDRSKDDLNKITSVTSRLDKFEMDIITDEDEIQPKQCYVLLTNPMSFVFNNDKKNHKPIQYKLNAQPILGLNKRLNNILDECIAKSKKYTIY